MAVQRHSIRTRLRQETGMSLVFIGMGFMAIFAGTTLAIDVGLFMTARAQAQNAADAGALSGATAFVYNSFADRNPGGPAVQSAINTAKQNKVVGDVVSIEPADVTFPLGPTGRNDRVQVWVYRSTARGNNIPTLIGSVFGVQNFDIAAMAIAEAAPANAMTCVKPFTIPDKWVENNSPPWTIDSTFDRYDNRGRVIPNADVYEPAYIDNTPPNRNPNYSGYNMEANRGVKLVLRAGTGNNIQPSFYFSLSMTDDMGGQDYRWNIANCNHSIYHWGDPLVQEPGAMEGPTIQGIEELIAKDPNAVWDTGTNTVKNSAFGEGRQSPRIFPIPLFDPDYYNAGKENGRAASLRVANWIGFFVEYIGSGNEIHGRIIPIGGIRDKTWTGGTADFPKAIRLVQ